MKVSTILDHIDSGHMALPEFQRGYVWNRDQVRGLFESLYKRHPVGGLLVWATESRTATHRGDSKLAPGIVKLLLDGQQRMTTIYGVLRGHPPAFFDGNARAFTGLWFHLGDERFQFHQPQVMKDDPLWVDVTELMRAGHGGVGVVIERLATTQDIGHQVGSVVGRVTKLLGIADIELHVEEVAGPDKTIDVVVDIFNRVNSGGTKLSKGDLALAKICADWVEARDSMKGLLDKWNQAGFKFNLDWLLRSVNTVLTGEAKFQFLHAKEAHEIQEGLGRAARHIDTCLNMIGGRLGLDHDQVFFGKFAVPVMVRHLDMRGKALNERERDKLLFWFVQAGMWGRFSGTTESFIDQDLAALEREDGGVDALLEQLRLSRGGLRVEAGHFTGWSLGARFYPVLYMLTRMGEARDWGTGLPLRANLLGRMNRLEVHHIFPKSQLYRAGHQKTVVNALANFCFLTKDTNLDITNRLPEEYFLVVEAAHPGALASQWIPEDRELWKLKNYRDFLEARKELLAAELNRRLLDLLHGDDMWLRGPSASIELEASGGDEIASPDEERELEALNSWVEQQGLPSGSLNVLVEDPSGQGSPVYLDLAWPTGLQEELSEPVAVLLGETASTIERASQAGYQCFTTVRRFKSYVRRRVLVLAEDGEA